MQAGIETRRSLSQIAAYRQADVACNPAKADMEFARTGTRCIEPYRLARRIVAIQLSGGLDCATRYHDVAFAAQNRRKLRFGDRAGAQYLPAARFAQNDYRPIQYHRCRRRHR